jgi:hypothetical protein
LAERFQIIIPVTLPTGTNPQGGAGKGGWLRYGGYAHALKEINKYISLHMGAVFTTFFDLYGFPSDISCSPRAKTVTDAVARAKIYEDQMTRDIHQSNKDVRFLPHIQPCEFEALLFAAPNIAAKMLAADKTDKKEISKIQVQLENIRNQFSTPEHINLEQPPSKRLEKIVPGYKKNKVGRAGFSWMIPKEIGISELRKQCPHFNEWIAALEDYPNT